MIVLKNSLEVQDHITQLKKTDTKISFVPTMGFLHRGHLELMEFAKNASEHLVVSIFVNPAQFNDPNDLRNYPIDINGDLEKCERIGVDAVFLPGVEDIYPSGIPKVNIQIPHLMNVLCGRTRPGHFEGVLLVLARLFHLVCPDLAVFGKKDYQQFKIVSYFVESMGFPIEVMGRDTVRESDGLAMSSRNSRLTPVDREAALLLSRCLNIAQKVLEEGERNISVFKEILIDILAVNAKIRLDYLEIVDLHTLEEKTSLDGDLLIAIAAFVGNVRLIDNKEITIQSET